MKLKQAIGVYYRKRYERENQYQTCEPYFYRFIGVDDARTYPDELKTLEELIQEQTSRTVFFEGEIPLQADFQLIESIKQELLTMNIGQLETQEITIFNDLSLNQIFLKALSQVVELAVRQESFFSEYTRNDFIAKLILWSHQHLTSLNFNGHYLPKAIYYGDIDRHAIYFLMLMYHMGMDVLYLNPLKETLFEQVDTPKWSQQQQAMGVLPIETFDNYARQGQTFTQLETTTKLIQQEFHDSFFGDTGLFKPWQYRSGTTRPVVLDTILEDVYVYWNEHARLRQGFRVNGSTVQVPCFFNKVDGVYPDRLKYKRLIECCCSAPQTMVVTNGMISSEVIVEQEMYQLMFCQLSDGTFDLDELKKLSFYRWNKYSEEVQQFLLQKFNELIRSDQYFPEKLSHENILRLGYLILTLDESIVRAVDNFDFPADVPKVVIFLEEESELSERQVQILAYLSLIGFDLTLFNPSGLFNLARYLQPTVAVTHRLETMDYELTYAQAMKVRSGLFSNFFK